MKHTVKKQRTPRRGLNYEFGASSWLLERDWIMQAVVTFFFFFFLKILSSFLILFPGGGKEKNGDGFFLLDEQKTRTFEKRGPPHTNYASTINSAKCQGIPGK